MNDQITGTPNRNHQNWLNFARLVLIPISLILALILWGAIIQIANPPAFLLPSPGLVFNRFLDVLGDGSLARHLSTTLSEVLIGLAIGVSAATVLGYFLAKFPIVERLIAPYVVASQSVPIVAIAPLLVIWFPEGIFSKVMICALIVFFPVLVNTIVGLRSVPEDLRDLMRSLQASRFQTIRFLEVPAALPVFLGGLRIGATLAVIGAVVGEFVGSDRGLGFMINQARGLYDTALVFVAVFVLISLALGLYAIVVFFEKRLLAWHLQPDQMEPAL